MDEDINNQLLETIGEGGGPSTTSGSGPTSGGTTTTTTTTTRGLCQASADCGPGFTCDVSNPTFPTDDLTNPFGVCVQCTPKDTFLRCEAGYGVYADGNCGEQKTTILDGKCPPPNGTFIECIGADATYHDGNGGIRTENNAKICLDICAKENPDNKFIQCIEGTTTAVVHDGKCGKREIANDSRCSKACEENGKFIGCDGTTGKYHDGKCGVYTVALDTVNKCYTPPPAKGTFIRCDLPHTAIFADGAGGETAVQNSVDCGFIAVNDSNTVIDKPSPEFATLEVAVNPNLDGVGSVTVRYSDSPTVQNNQIASTNFSLNINQVNKAYPVQITATANENWVFSGWERDSNFSAVETQTVLSGTVLNNTKIIAKFIPKEIETAPTPPPPPTLPPPKPTWRSCVDGNLNEGIPPAGYKNVVYTGAGGGTCWEPVSTIGFNPPLDSAFTFLWRRGATSYPTPIRVQATNTSAVSAYSVKFNTNQDIVVNPKSFILSPRATETFSVTVLPSLLNVLGDGTSLFDINVEILEL